MNGNLKNLLRSSAWSHVTRGYWFEWYGTYLLTLILGFTTVRKRHPCIFAECYEETMLAGRDDEWRTEKAIHVGRRLLENLNWLDGQNIALKNRHRRPLTMRVKIRDVVYVFVALACLCILHVLVTTTTTLSHPTLLTPTHSLPFTPPATPTEEEFLVQGECKQGYFFFSLWFYINCFLCVMMESW